jgi:hypothetical protein
MEVEQPCTCPYCWQNITFMLDLSVPGQTYVQDCEVCCNPITISYTVDNGTVSHFDAQTLDG